jgi:hypothetical protein
MIKIGNRMLNKISIPRDHRTGLIAGEKVDVEKLKVMVNRDITE